MRRINLNYAMGEENARRNPITFIGKGGDLEELIRHLEQYPHGTKITDLIPTLYLCVNTR